MLYPDVFPTQSKNAKSIATRQSIIVDLIKILRSTPLIVVIVQRVDRVYDLSHYIIACMRSVSNIIGMRIFLNAYPKTRYPYLPLHNDMSDHQNIKHDIYQQL